MKKTQKKSNCTNDQDGQSQNRKVELPTEFFSTFSNYKEEDDKTIVTLDLSALIDRLIKLEEDLNNAVKEKAEAVFQPKQR